MTVYFTDYKNVFTIICHRNYIKLKAKLCPCLKLNFQKSLFPFSICQEHKQTTFFSKRISLSQISIVAFPRSFLRLRASFPRRVDVANKSYTIQEETRKDVYFYWILFCLSLSLKRFIIFV